MFDYVFDKISNSWQRWQNLCSFIKFLNSKQRELSFFSKDSPSTSDGLLCYNYFMSQMDARFRLRYVESDPRFYRHYYRFPGYPLKYFEDLEGILFVLEKSIGVEDPPIVILPDLQEGNIEPMYPIEYSLTEAVLRFLQPDLRRMTPNGVTNLKPELLADLRNDCKSYVRFGKQVEVFQYDQSIFFEFQPLIAGAYREFFGYYSNDLKEAFAESRFLTTLLEDRQ